MKWLILTLALSGCAPLAIAGGVGILDVTAFHGCIGVTLANVLPWNKPQTCNLTTGSNPAMTLRS